MDEADEALLRRTSKKTKKQLVAEYYEIAERTHALSVLGMPFEVEKEKRKEPSPEVKRQRKSPRQWDRNPFREPKI